MKEDEKARLVFSTETHVEGCEQFTDGGLGSEARQERNEQVSLLNKSIRRPIKERMNTKNNQTKEDVSTIVAFLWADKAKVKDIYSHLYKTDIKDKAKYSRVSNLLQVIRFGSKGVIFTKNGYWQLVENYPSTFAYLVQQIMDNRKYLWEKKSSKGAEKPDNNRKMFQDRILRKPIKRPPEINKQIVVKTPLGEMKINLNIKITVEVL